MSSREHHRRFHFIREIASGGFGSVFLTKVMHADGFSRLVAVKLLKAQWSDSDEVARRMRDEARLLGLLRHRNIVDVIDLTSIDGRAAVIMEYLEAVDLRMVSQELASQGLRMPVRTALDIAGAVASALDAAYNRPPIPGDKPLRVIHRDIKPSNIMVDETGMVKVLDFGVARSEIDNRESHTQELQFGSVDYMAPERLFFEPETPASDVYSLAATLFEILALEKFGKARGRPARHAAYVVDRLSFLRACLHIPNAAAAELEKLIGDGLAFNHEDRPTAAEFYQRARTLARLVEDDDLPTWAERYVPPMVRAHQDAQKAESPNPLSDQVLVEDAKLFGRDDSAPRSQSVGAADVLRQGALAEMEDTGAFVPTPPTGAPAQLRGKFEPDADEPEPESEWDDGPTAVGGLKGAVRVPRPSATEDARSAGRGGRPSPAILPDPSDPFSQLIRPSPMLPAPRHTSAAAVDRDLQDEGADDGATDVAEPLVPPAAVGGASNAGGAGHYDPDAPVSSGPVPPLRAPPGVEGRPLEPDLRAWDAPVVAAKPTSPQAAADPVVPHRHSRQPDETDVDADLMGFGDETPEEATEVMGAFDLPPSPIGGVAASPVAQAASAAPPAIPVVRAAEAATARPVAAPAARAAAAPPSLDDVVPQSADSRYGPEVAVARAVESGDVVPQVAVVEATEDEDSAMPAPPPAKPAGKSKAPLLVGAGCFAFVLLVGAGVLVFTLFGAQLQNMLQGAAAPSDVASVEAIAPEGTTGSATEEPAAEEPTTDLPDGVLRVTAMSEDARKLTVECKGAKGSGESTADVAVAEISGPCTVKLVRGDRSRSTAVIENPEAGHYRCFADGADGCARE